MKKWLFAIGLLLLGAAQAKAEDFYWTGFYAGVIGGGGAGPSTFFTASSGFTTSFDISGGLLGVEIGAALQVDEVVLGAAADIVLSSIEGSAACDFGAAATCAGSVPWLGTIRVKAGTPVGPALVYATGGLAFGQVDVTRTAFGRTATQSGRQVGWTAGFGAEMPITADLTARAEYLYTDLGTLGVDFTSTDPVAYSAAFHSIRLGAGFRF